jgi:uncharacterized protein YmfQ (DUF2313 family)
MSGSSTVQKTAPTLESLAERLRDGPLKCLTALQDHAEALAEQQPTGSRELLERLQSLVSLAQCSMTRFYEFTAELRTLVDHVTEESAADSAKPH